MKKTLLVSLVMVSVWTGCAHGQAFLGSPVTNTAPCDSCNHPSINLVNPTEGKTSLGQSGLGQLARSMMAPIRLATGNLLPSGNSEGISKEEVARMMTDGSYSQAELAAAKIKLDETQAKTRRAAVRYLATVNCHYYPEAELGLMAALRADRNEGVRLEAALALGSCHCLTSRIVDALSVSAMGVETDGNPAETSPRVRAAARTALDRCLAHGIYVPVPTPQMLPPPDFSVPTPQPSSLPAPLTIQPSSYVVPGMPQVGMQQALSPSLQYERSRAESVGCSPAGGSLSTGQRTFYHLMLNAAQRENLPAASQEQTHTQPRHAPILPSAPYND